MAECPSSNANRTRSQAHGSSEDDGFQRRQVKVDLMNNLLHAYKRIIAAVVTAAMVLTVAVAVSYYPPGERTVTVMLTVTTTNTVTASTIGAFVSSRVYEVTFRQIPCYAGSWKLAYYFVHPWSVTLGGETIIRPVNETSLFYQYTNRLGVVQETGYSNSSSNI